ncbi:MAG: hypothetical protein K8J08_00785 [Thermoanaerobaculia bacterium]|nr:hypothetical protein [Thermoanaerobaculia bacterium]
MSYHLAAWDDQQLLRQPQVLDDARLAILAAEYASSIRPAPPLLMLPLFGMLPRADQELLESDRGISPLLGTAASAVLILMLTIPLCAAAFLTLSDPHGFGVDHPELAWTRTTALVWFYFFAESLARLLISLAWELASGTLPVVLAIGIPRAVRQHRTTTSPRADRGPRPQDLFEDVDRVRRLPATERDPARLEVLSRLPKPDWTVGARPIRFEGSCYDLCQHDQLGNGSSTHHRFLLQPVSSEVLTRDPIEYEPSEAGRRARDLVRAARSAWIAPLGVLWGYLPEATQRRLETHFDYDPESSLRLNIAVTLGFAGLTTLIALFHWMGPSSTLFDPVILAASLYIVWESARRRRRLSAGHIAPSVLGRVVEPFARRLLRDL